MPNDVAAQNTGQPQQLSPMQELRGSLDKMRGEIAKALPQGIDPDRFIRIVVTAVQMSPALIDADRRSLMASCMKAAQDGLMPDGREAVLNIYNTKQKVWDERQGKEVEHWVPTVQYLPMVRGLLKVARNSGEIAHIDAAAVYEKDEFIFERGDEPKLVHRPYLGADDPGQVIASYVVAKLNNGEVHREVMTKRDIEKVRAASKSPNGPMWKDWYDQASIKAVIKRGSKLLPQSSDRLARAIEHDNEAMGFEFNQRGTDTTQLVEGHQAKALENKPTGRPSRLHNIVAGAQPVDATIIEQGQQDDGAQQPQAAE